MNILFFCPFKFNLNSNDILSLGGIESLNIELCKELAKKDFNISLASFCTKTIYKDKINNIPIKTILKKKENYHFDVVISSNDPSIFNIYKNSKKILWVHNTLSLEKALRKKKFFTIVKNKISAVFVSKYLKDITSKLYFFDKKVVVPNFLSNIFIVKKHNFKRKPIFVWSVQREKGLNQTINTWINDIYPINKKAQLFIYGINTKNYINRKKYYNKSNIHFFGRVSKTELKKVYLKATAMICLGFDETFCLNALEANACGLPVITFGKTALKKYVLNNYNGFTVNTFSEIASKVKYLINIKSRNEIIKNSILMSKKFSLNNIIHNWLKLLK
jgi:glycosyltransferase involved in cell wall biosynthesis